MKAPITKPNPAAYCLRPIPRIPKYLTLIMGTDAFKFGDLVNSSTARYFVCSCRTAEEYTKYKMRIVREPYGRLLYYWLYFRFVTLNALGDMLFTHYRWYRKHIGGVWSYIQCGDKDLYCRMWVRGKALQDTVLRKECYPIKY